MRLRMHLTQPLDGDLGVDLSGVELDVTEHLLDGAHVCSTLEHMRGHGVPNNPLIPNQGIGIPFKWRYPLDVLSLSGRSMGQSVS
jgi:hypothetical protein